MSQFGQPEINDGDADILIVGRDFGRNEQRVGRPFVGRAGGILDDALSEAGLLRSELAITNVVNKQPPGNVFEAHRQADIKRGLSQLRETVARVDPNLIVALGNVASWALVEDWPGDTIRDAKLIQDRRGYLWTSRQEFGSRKVLTTVHPAFCDRAWVPWRALLTLDLERAKEEADGPGLERPTRSVTVPTNERDCQRAVRHLERYQRLAADIEISSNSALACIGFAGSSDQAYVFPARRIAEVRSLFRKGSPRIVWQNGQFDRYFLKTRCGIDAPVNDDTILAWHSLYPELAGKSQQKSYKQTQKSLAFLASIYTKDAYWKNYEFENEREMYELNGRDCCITFDIMQQMDEEIDRMGVRGIYEHSLSLVPVVVDMQARGLLVDDEERRRRIEALSKRFGELEEEINEIAIPILKEHREDLEEVWHLFVQKWTCPCCRNGSTKREECYSCGGFESKPNKSDVVERFGNPDDLNKDALFAQVFGPCEVCEGEGQRKWLEFNPNSNQQKETLLYDLLNVRERYKNGSRSVAEDKLKDALAEVS